MKPVTSFSGIDIPVFDAVVAAGTFLHLSVYFHMPFGILRTFLFSKWILGKGLQQNVTPGHSPLTCYFEDQAVVYPFNLSF